MDMYEKKINIIIDVPDDVDTVSLGHEICESLVGNPDFIDNNFVVNYTNDPNTIDMYIDTINGSEDIKTAAKSVFDKITN